MDVKDIPQEMMAQIRQQFDSNPDVVKLRVRQRQLLMAGNAEAALAMGATIEKLFADVVLEYMQEAEKNLEKVNLSDLHMTTEDEERVAMLGIVMFMACDIIESAVIDVDDTIHRYNKEYSFEMFNDIRELSRMAKEKLKFFQHESAYMEDLAWGNLCDESYKLLTNKASKLVRMRKESKNWGENAKKLSKK